MLPSSKLYLVCFLLPLGFFKVNSQNTTITIPINRNLTLGDKQLYGDFVTINASSTLQVNLADANKKVSFVIFQVHSHLYNVSLYNNTLMPSSLVVGTNVGLYSSVKPKLDTFYVYNQNNVDLKVYIAVLGYGAKDPIPGGCNMEFPTAISPYMRTSVNKDYILVDMAPPRLNNDDPCCLVSHNFIKQEYYMLYLRESNFDADSYFDGLQKMLTLDNIKSNGQLIPESGEPMRRRIAAYPGTGAIYVVVAYDALIREDYSVYVPDTSYSCDPLVEGDCSIMKDGLSLFLCLCLYGIGIFLCYFAHQFFKTEMFLIGFLWGMIITYIVISVNANIDGNVDGNIDGVAMLGASIISGVCFGAIWLLLWWFYGIPVLSMILPILGGSFLVAAYSYYVTRGGDPPSRVDLKFWSIFVAIMTTNGMVLMVVHMYANFFCTALIGSYAIVYSIGFSVGSHLNYILINTIRRAVVPKFNYALLMPPFGWKDTIVAVVWLVLWMTGASHQSNHNTGRSPYPPPPKSFRAVMPGLNYGTIRQVNRQNNENIDTENNENVSSENNETTRLLV